MTRRLGSMTEEALLTSLKKQPPEPDEMTRALMVISFGRVVEIEKIIHWLFSRFSREAQSDLLDCLVLTYLIRELVQSPTIVALRSTSEEPATVRETIRRVEEYLLSKRQDRSQPVEDSGHSETQSPSEDEPSPA